MAKTEQEKVLRARWEELQKTALSAKSLTQLDTLIGSISSIAREAARLDIRLDISNVISLLEAQVNEVSSRRSEENYEIKRKQIEEKLAELKEHELVENQAILHKEIHALSDAHMQIMQDLGMHILEIAKSNAELTKHINILQKLSQGIPIDEQSLKALHVGLETEFKKTEGFHEKTHKHHRHREDISATKEKVDKHTKTLEAKLTAIKEQLKQDTSLTPDEHKKLVEQQQRLNAHLKAHNEGVEKFHKIHHEAHEHHEKLKKAHEAREQMAQDILEQSQKLASLYQEWKAKDPTRAAIFEKIISLTMMSLGDKNAYNAATLRKHPEHIALNSVGKSMSQHNMQTNSSSFQNRFPPKNITQEPVKGLGKG